MNVISTSIEMVIFSSYFLRCFIIKLSHLYGNISHVEILDGSKSVQTEVHARGGRLRSK